MLLMKLVIEVILVLDATYESTLSGEAEAAAIVVLQFVCPSVITSIS
jgi:hypothetical protein